MCLSESTVRDMVFSNRIPSFKCGGGKRAARRFQGAELNDWLSRTDDSKPAESLAVRRPRIKGKGSAVKEFEDYVKGISE